MAANAPKDLLDLYNTTTALRPAAARTIPGPAVNYFDQNNIFSKNFTLNEQLLQTEFTDKALNYYDNELTTIVTPPGFTPIEPGVTLNRWSEEKPYNVPGLPANDQ